MKPDIFKVIGPEGEVIAERVDLHHYQKLQQELDAARLKHKEKELNLEGLIANRNKQLADAKAQIADYEEALSKYPANSHAYNALKKWRNK